MKASKKYLMMEIEFMDYSDLQMAFAKAWQSIKSGKDWNRFKSGSAIAQFNVQRYFDENDFEEIEGIREELIDGKLCIIIPSKMNELKKGKK